MKRVALLSVYGYTIGEARTETPNRNEQMTTTAQPDERRNVAALLDEVRGIVAPLFDELAMEVAKVRRAEASRAA